MFGIGPMELIVVAVVAIVVVGPKRLPEMMRKLGRIFVQVRRQTNDIRQGFNDVVREAERDLELEKIRELKQQVDKFRDCKSIELRSTNTSTSPMRKTKLPRKRLAKM